MAPEKGPDYCDPNLIHQTIPLLFNSFFLSLKHLNWDKNYIYNHEQCKKTYTINDFFLNSMQN